MYGKFGKETCMIFPFLTIFLVIIIYTTYKRQKSTAKSEKTFADFWKKEQDANCTRKKDISDLDYIHVPLAELPFGKYPEEGFEDLELEIRALSEQPICNLNGIMNTDLKMQYGPANLDFLTECDTNYSTLVRLLASYGDRMYNHFHNEDAQIVLEYAISIQSDIAKSYITLANIYVESGQTDKLLELRQCADRLDSIRRNAILAKLDNYIPPELREKLEEEALLMAEAETVLDDDEFELEDMDFTITEKEP